MKSQKELNYLAVRDSNEREPKRKTAPNYSFKNDNPEAKVEAMKLVEERRKKYGLKG